MNCYLCVRTPVTYVSGLYTLLGEGGGAYPLLEESLMYTPVNKGM